MYVFKLNVCNVFLGCKGYWGCSSLIGGKVWNKGFDF